MADRLNPIGGTNPRSIINHQSLSKIQRHFHERHYIRSGFWVSSSSAKSSTLWHSVANNPQSRTILTCQQTSVVKNPHSTTILGHSQHYVIETPIHSTLGRSQESVVSDPESSTSPSQHPFSVPLNTQFSIRLGHNEPRANSNAATPSFEQFSALGFFFVFFCPVFQGGNCIHSTTTTRRP